MASTNFYDLYIQSVVQLAETIVIKSADTADGLNQYVIEQKGGSVNTLDPTTWKYYLNITGEYHSTDTMMTVTSMDTLEQINFTKENLKTHLATAKGYQYGTRSYQELVARYPDQELLILGVLYPADMTMAVESPDGTILAYPPNLVEANEYSLIDKLQNWIYSYKGRWINVQYSISDPLYSFVHHGIMYLMLLLQILGYRLEACKTNEAHSYHVRMYLASHQGLDQYLDFMTTKQALWFYRNICYIERNTGQRQIFDLLLEHIMTERNLPLAEYLMKHDISKMPDDMDPTVTFVRTPLNIGNVDSNNVVDLDQMLTKEQGIARDNAAYQGDYEPLILEKMRNSKSSTLMSKALSSEMVDYSNSSPYTLSDILLNHWLWLASKGSYSAFVSATNPQTGEAIPISVKDAWTLMWYCWMGSNGIDLSKSVIPAMFAQRVQRIPTPTTTDLLSVVDPKLVDVTIAQKALSMQPSIVPILSTEAFYETCVQITAAANMQLNLVAFMEHKDRRAYVEGMVERIYSDNVVYTAPPDQTYASWFSERNLNLSTFSNDQLNLLYLDLVKKATGLDLINSQSLAALQAAMVSMFKRLSSYSVQFLAKINSSPIRMVNWPIVRVGDVKGSGSAEYYMPDNTVDVMDETVKGSALWEVDINHPQPRENYLFKMHVAEQIELTAKPHLGQNAVQYNYNVKSVVGVKLSTPLQPNDVGVIPVVGTDAWLALPPEERYQFADVWRNNNYYYTPPPEEPLDVAIFRQTLNGLTWIDRTPPRFATTTDLDGLAAYDARMLTLSDLDGFKELNQ